MSSPQLSGIIQEVFCMKLELKMKLICLGLLTLAQAARAEGGDHSGGGAVGVCFDDSIIVQKIKANENRILTDHISKFLFVNTGSK